MHDGSPEDQIINVDICDKDTSRCTNRCIEETGASDREDISMIDSNKWLTQEQIFLPEHEHDHLCLVSLSGTLKKKKKEIQQPSFLIFIYFAQMKNLSAQ